MNRQLAKAIVSAFRTDDAEALRRWLAAFDEREWARTKQWLHTSGMALHFLDRATKLGIEDAMPPSLVHELSVNLAENRARTADLFQEFVRLNTTLQRAGISYVNVKGFSLAPTAFADPALRYQQDLDFLVGRHELERFARVLEAQGYRFKAIYGESWEFSAGTPAKSSPRDLYRVRPVKNVEVHPMPLAEEARMGHGGDRLSRMRLRMWNGFEFPALGDADQLLLQASHIFQHLQSEWTRTSWLLEYHQAVCARKNDDEVWRDATAALTAAPEMRTGVAIASLVTARSFGTEFPQQFAEQTLHRLRPEVRLWVERYRDELMLNRYPGSKLYLLLQDILEGGGAQWQAKRRKRLLPLHTPTRVMPKGGKSLRMLLAAEIAQLRFTAKRFSFHVVEGLRYKREAARWRKLMAGASLQKSKEAW